MVRWIISISVGGTSIYGPLAAPIVLMIWLYVLAIAVLIGAALNAAVESVWPRREITEAREEWKPATSTAKPNPGTTPVRSSCRPTGPRGRSRWPACRSAVRSVTAGAGRGWAPERATPARSRWPEWRRR